MSDDGSRACGDLSYVCGELLVAKVHSHSVRRPAWMLAFGRFDFASYPEVTRASRSDKSAAKSLVLESAHLGEHAV